ncbi:MAG: hypothetical protein IJR70_01335 [Eubacterium sp.]|nr:hypothetical protein [Eubacterium sp.]
MKKTGIIILLSVLMLNIGVAVAYKNTKQLLYDNSRIISFSSESVSIYDYNIDYKDIRKTANNIKNTFSTEPITI